MLSARAEVSCSKQLAEIEQFGGHMDIEALGSIIFTLIVAFLIWHLHKSGKQIQQRQRDLEEK